VLSSFNEVRKFTEQICKPLQIEDYVIQSMPDVSPPKWHLGHTTWFFENFILKEFVQNFSPFHPQYNYLFNSYYKTVGSHFQRCRRGLLSRPTVNEIYSYRHHVNDEIRTLLETTSEATLRLIQPLLILGLQHEQQHQELLFSDIKNIFWTNPLKPSYLEGNSRLEAGHGSNPSSHLRNDPWKSFTGGICEIGYSGQDFAYDNERPKHKVYLEDFSLSSQLITNQEYLEFIDAGGYSQPALWLSEGWNCIEKFSWQAPLYWEKIGADWWTMTPSGMKPLVLEEPVCHVSYFEADAYARWRGARLPTEAEWEVAASDRPIRGNFAEKGVLHPLPFQDDLQLYGDVWEWTQSPYSPYPGFQTLPGSIGEYNGKFMCNQFVLRGGSCATPKSHIRPTYRNFFAPDIRWQFTGFRLAKAFAIA
jgi:ergothioneine biosynthesis protein EgtB